MFTNLYTSEIESSESESDTKNKNDEVKLKKELRSNSNVMSLSDSEFTERFRLNKQAFQDVLENLNLNAGLRTTKITPTLQLAMVLQLLAKGTHQNIVGNDCLIAMGQSTVSTFFWRIIDKMESVLCPKWIRFDVSDDTMLHYYEKYKIPGIVGCIDGTHVTFLKPANNKAIFHNIMGTHSINVMIITDHNLKILAVNAKYGGRSQDSFIWKMCSERSHLENIYLNAGVQRLLGDSGYPLEPWLLTPYRNAIDEQQNKYNEMHSSAMKTVQCCFSLLKERFKIVSEDCKRRYTPVKIAKLVNVCCALHNICIHYKIPFDYKIIAETINIEFDGENDTFYRNFAENLRTEIKDHCYSSSLI